MNSPPGTFLYGADDSKRRSTKTRATIEAGSQEEHSYRPLPDHFRHGGFAYRQIAREGDAAIYEQTWAGCPDPSIRFEVIRIRRRDGFHIGERFAEPAEVYPNSESWGTDGWTVTDRETAFRKLREIRSAFSRDALR